ncbi:MAG: hypothetical protein CMJ49_09775 [Planctomycetaceae bacterium]|nr:hypothetical protein [Planctomycetaceae bacterium]
MGKIFYTLEETAERLGLNEDEIKALAEEGKLQPYRDRDRLMFKRDEVESLGGDAEDDADELQLSADESTLGQVDINDETDALLADDSVGLDVGSDSDAVDLRDETSAGFTESPKSKTATGISVFDADEVQPADEGAETVMASPMSAEEEELTLDSVGSGSGLLDLTKESDDTSLGAEIMDDVTMTADSADDSGAVSPMAGTSMFGAVGEVDAATASGFGQDAMAVDSPLTDVSYADHGSSPAADGFIIGLLIGATAALIVTAIVLTTGVMDTLAQLTTKFGESLMIYCGAMIGGSLVIGIIGYLIGRAMDR